MPLRNTDDRWAWPSMTLHWLIAALILALLAVGMVMVELPRSPRYFWVYDLHKSLGLAVLALMLLRLGWRLYAGAPRPVPGTSAAQHLLAQGVHLAIYVLALALPISGWLYDSASGLRAMKFFGAFTVPKLVSPDLALKNLAHAVHEWGAWLLIALIVLHAGGALIHHLVQRDRTLSRMLPASFENPR